MKSFLASLLIGIAALPASAEQGIWVLGYNLRTCGSWTKERRANSTSAVVLHAWITGYLSGAAMTGIPGLLGGIDNEAIDGWIDNYCSAHPLVTLGEASVALVKELRSRTPNSN